MPAATTSVTAAKGPAPASRLLSLLPGAVITAVAVGVAYAVHALVPVVGTLILAVLLGVVLANSGLVPARAVPGLAFITRRMLRSGVVLLGFSLSLTSIASLGAPMVLLVVVTVATTLLATTWLGVRMGLSRPRSLLIGTGFAICGASAVAGMEQAAEGDEEDVTVAIAMVTICGTVAMLVLPLLQAPLHLNDRAFGAWTGASIHEVGQVVAAAGTAGPAALAVAVIVKLTRVLMLAPAVAAVNLQRRHRAQRGVDEQVVSALPPLVPVFVLGFLGCMVLRTSGVIPHPLLSLLVTLQGIVLAAALFGMGTQVHVRRLRGAGRALVLSAISTVLIGLISLGGVTFVLR